MIDIAGHRVGPDEPTYIVAECGVSHNGRIDLALRLVDAAKRAGADAAKFQVWRTSRLLAADSPQYRTLLPLELSYGQLEHVKRHCDDVGITFFATPDQAEDADFLESLGVPAYKIGSGHVADLALLRHMAAFGKPVILSTGMSDMAMVLDACEAINRAGNNQIVLLHCVSAYPAKVDDCNLRAMAVLREFGYPVGFSDHTIGCGATLAAVALGASVIERHLTLDTRMEGPDHAASLDPEMLACLVSRIRDVEVALGDGVKRPMVAEDATRAMVGEWRR